MYYQTAAYLPCSPVLALIPSRAWKTEALSKRPRGSLRTTCPIWTFSLCSRKKTIEEFNATFRRLADSVETETKRHAETQEKILVRFTAMVNIRAVYTRESKPRITQSAAYVSRELSHLYDNSLHKKLVRGSRKPRTSISCRLYEQFAAYISRGLCNPRLIFPRINRPIACPKALRFIFRKTARARVPHVITSVYQPPHQATLQPTTH